MENTPREMRTSIPFGFLGTIITLAVAASSALVAFELWGKEVSTGIMWGAALANASWLVADFLRTKRTNKGTD